MSGARLSRAGRRPGGPRPGRSHRVAVAVASAAVAGLAVGLAVGITPSTTPASSAGAQRPALGKAVGSGTQPSSHPSTSETRQPRRPPGGAGKTRSAPTTLATTTTTAVTTTTRPAPTTTGAVSTTTTPGGCGGPLPAAMAATGGGTQLVTVEASGYGTTYATLTAWSERGSCWSVAYGPYLARLGSSGLAPAARKREGDGATPEGLYGFGAVMYGNAGNPGVHYPYHQLACGDWWDEDPSSPQYNLFVHWPCGSTPPFAQGPSGAGSEALWTETTPYPSFAVIAYNTARTPGRGSAIFLHAGTAYPTVGCVSVDLSALDLVLDWLDPSRSPAIAIGTSADIRSE
jgi:L,D-peptidoglycan transpeptidase YkuD (ErfK/YbiS/YcfS/YnhG family)